MGDSQDTSRALYTSIRGLPKDWRRRPGRPRRTWLRTSSRSITVWTQPGDSFRTENDGSNSWKRLRSSQGHARDDDDDFSPGQYVDATTSLLGLPPVVQLLGGVRCAWDCRELTHLVLCQSITGAAWLSHHSTLTHTHSLSDSVSLSSAVHSREAYSFSTAAAYLTGKIRR